MTKRPWAMCRSLSRPRQCPMINWTVCASPVIGDMRMKTVGTAGELHG